MPEWQKVVFTIDSVAPDTVVPPRLPLIPGASLGTEYDVANEGVVVNMGGRFTSLFWL